MPTILTPSGATGGPGSDSLTLAMGKNTTRAQKTYDFSISGDGGTVSGENMLTVTQDFTPLSNTYNNTASTNMVESTSAQSLTFSGKANGRYLKCVSNSQYISITSCQEYSIPAGHAVGTSFTAVSNFEGGSTEYNYLISASLAANAPTTSSGYTITVTTADSTTDTGIAQTFTVKVAASGSGATAITSVSIDQHPLTLGIGNANRKTLTYSPTPVNADIASVTWSSDNSSIAAIGSNNGIATGVTEGSTAINISVTDTQGNTVTGVCYTTVYANGTISASNVTAKSVARSASSTVTYSNIDLTKAITVSESADWITGAEANINGSSVEIILDLNANNGSSARSATVTVSAKDMLNKTRTCTFTVTQNAYSTSDVPCTSMSIGGNSTLNNSGNTNEYTAAYAPSGTTQIGCTWSIVSGSSYAEFESTGNPAVLKAKAGASASSVVIRATNSYNSSIYAEKTVTVTYVAPQGYLSIEDAAGNDASSQRVHAVDTYLDHTNGAPRVVATNIQPNSVYIPAKAMGGFSGFIDSATVTTYNGVMYVEVEFTANTTGSERTGQVVVHALDGNSDDVSATIGYTQAAGTVTSHNIAITAFEVIQNGAKVNVSATVAYHNGAPTTTTFYTPSYIIKGYDSNDEEQTSKTGTFSNVEVTGYGTRSITYTKTEVNAFAWNGTLDDHYTMIVSSGSTTSETATYTPEE